MAAGFLYAGLALALLGALAIILFESAVRNAAGLITVFIGVACASAALGAELVPGTMLWIGGGGIGLPMLAAVLLLNLGADERGARRFRVRPAFSIPVVALLWAALAAILSDAVPDPATINAGAAAGAAVVRAPSGADVARAVVEDLAIPATAAVLALAASSVAAIALVRRRT